jgi:group I intron endonuclease
MMKSGIYLIQCLLNGKSYIGQSINVDSRIKDHKYKLLNNKHNNIYLQRAWNKYGHNNFSFSKCIDCDKEHLDNYEKFYIKLFNSLEYGYNLEDGGNLNKNISEKSKEKMSIAKLGKPSSRKGIKASDELKLKLSIAHKGIPNKRKGIKTNKPAWNSGKKGLQISSRQIKVKVIDTFENKYIGTFNSIMDFQKTKNYKSKNYTKLSETEIKIGRYLFVKLSKI